MSTTDAEHSKILREKINELVTQYFVHAFPQKPFVGGMTPIPVSGKVFDADELHHLVDSSLDFWLTTGRFALQFETQFAEIMG